MRKSESLSEPSATLLKYLRSLASKGEGYEVRGVRGWARPLQVERETAVYGAAEYLRRLALRGRLTREDVRVRDSATGAVWVYRITDEGAQLVDEHEGWEHVPVHPPDDPVPNQAYVSSTVTPALDALRHAAVNAGPREWIQGQPEWRTSLELTNWLKAENDRTDVTPRMFFPGDLAWLVRNHLAQRLEQPAVIYRITGSGAALQPLVWHGTEPRET